MFHINTRWQRIFSKDHDILGEYDRWVGARQDRNTPAKSEREKAWHLQGSESSATELASFVEMTEWRVSETSTLGPDNQSISNSDGVLITWWSYYHVDANSVVPARGTWKSALVTTSQMILIIAGTTTTVSMKSLQAMFQGLDLREQRGANQSYF